MSARRLALGAVGALAFVYVAAGADLYLRGRSAYLEGEKWMEWAAKPELKRAHFEARFAARRAELERERDAGGLPASDFDKKLMLAAFERDQAVAESSYKYAYVWFQSAAELFSPPETGWTAGARERMVEARALWKRELDAKKIPYREYMLD